MGKLRKPRQKMCKKLSLKEKLSAIELFKKGFSNSETSLNFGVSLSEICYLIAHKEKFIKNGQNKILQTNTRIDTGENPMLENILLEWIKQKRSLNIPVNGPTIKEKALYINNELLKKEKEELKENIEEGTPNSKQCQKIKAMENFKASQGWLHRFKTRNGIRQITCKGEKSSADEDGSVAFRQEMANFFQENDYSLDNIYNADETGLYSKTLPKKTLALAEETKAFGFKECKERVTIMNCANATGSHKIPLLLIGRSSKPRCFKPFKDDLPLIYKAQKSSWMTRKYLILFYQLKCHLRSLFFISEIYVICS